MKLTPVEDEVFRELALRLQQTFGCIVITSTSTDRMKVLDKFLEGAKPQYPYVFMQLLSMAGNPESYVSNRMARHGLTALMDNSTGYNIRLLPTNFEFQIDFVTNKFQGVEVDNVVAFSRRWLMARRLGWLKFNINYGRLRLLVGATLSDSVSTPVLENKTEVEAAYTVSTNVTVHGYISEPILKEQSLITQIEVNGQIMNSDGSMPNNSQFISFERNDD